MSKCIICEEKTKYGSKLCNKCKYPAPGQKRCPSCLESLPSKAFHRNISKRDNLATECKKCSLQRNLKNYHKRRQRIKARIAKENAKKESDEKKQEPTRETLYPSVEDPLRYVALAVLADAKREYHSLRGQRYLGREGQKHLRNVAKFLNDKEFVGFWCRCAEISTERYLSEVL